MRSVRLVRWGGLSPVSQKGRFVPLSKLEGAQDPTATYHRPPARRGCYCFPEHVIEMFLVAWKIYGEDGEKVKAFVHPRRFEYSGKLWTHIRIRDSGARYYRTRDQWHETDTDSLPLILERYKWELNRELSSDWSWEKMKDFSLISRGWKRFAKDSFELFIERP